MKNLLVLFVAALAIGAGSILLAIGLDGLSTSGDPHPPTTQHTTRR